MKARQSPHQASQTAARYPQSDFYVLRAKELGYRGRPKRRRNKLQLVFGLVLFVTGITLVMQEKTGNGNTDASVSFSKENNEQQLAERIREHKYIQVAEMKGLIADWWSNPSPVSVPITSTLAPFPSPGGPTAGHAPAAVSAAASPSRIVPATRRALSPELALEVQIWRPIAHSNDAKLYKSYLRRYPSGTFAEIATAKLRSLHQTDNSNVARGGIVKRNEAKKSSSVDTSKDAANLLAEVSLSPQTPGRCRNLNIEACRQRCRNGEIRACHKLRRQVD
jgi:hypothetical protein